MSPASCVAPSGDYLLSCIDARRIVIGKQHDRLDALDDREASQIAGVDRRPDGEWIVTEDESGRIIAQELWNRVKARQSVPLSPAKRSHAG